MFWQPITTFSLVNVTGELRGGQKRVTILLGREIIFFLASLDAVMLLKCGSAALGIANHFNALHTEDGVLSFRILCGSVKMHIPLGHLCLWSIFSVCPFFRLIRENNAVSLNHVPAWWGGPWRFLSASEELRGSKDGKPLEVKLIWIRQTDAEWGLAVP